MYFTYFSSLTVSKASSPNAEYQPLLPTSNASSPLKESPLPPLLSISPSTLRKLIVTLLTQTITFLYLRYTIRFDLVGNVPPESLLILLSVPSVFLPLADSAVRQKLTTLTPQSTIRLMATSLTLSISMYTTLSSVSLVPASIPLSLLSAATFLVLFTTFIILKSSNQSSLNSLLFSLLILPCTALVLTSATSLAGFKDALAASLLSAFSFAAFCLFIYNQIDETVIYVAASAACGVLALVFADTIALRSIFSLSAVVSAVLVSTLVAATIDLAKDAPHWIAASPGISAPMVAVFAAFLFGEIPALTSILGLIMGSIVSIVLATHDGVKDSFFNGSNLFLVNSINKADRGTTIA